MIDIVVAGEPVQVAPNCSDTTDSVGFYFPRYNGTIGWFGGDVPQGRRRSCKERWAGELALEPQAHVAVAAARQLGQLTSSANARGFFLTESLQIEGAMKFNGRPLTVDAIRRRKP